MKPRLNDVLFVDGQRGRGLDRAFGTQQRAPCPSESPQSLWSMAVGGTKSKKKKDLSSGRSDQYGERLPCGSHQLPILHLASWPVTSCLVADVDMYWIPHFLTVPLSDPPSGRSSRLSEPCRNQCVTPLDCKTCGGRERTQRRGEERETWTLGHVWRGSTEQIFGGAETDRRGGQSLGHLVTWSLENWNFQGHGRLTGIFDGHRSDAIGDYRAGAAGEESPSEHSSK